MGQCFSGNKSKNIDRSSFNAYLYDDRKTDGNIIIRDSSMGSGRDTDITIDNHIDNINNTTTQIKKITDKEKKRVLRLLKSSSRSFNDKYYFDAEGELLLVAVVVVVIIV